MKVGKDQGGRLFTVLLGFFGRELYSDCSRTFLCCMNDYNKFSLLV